MAYPLLLLAAITASPSLDSAQSSYVQCLSSAFDTAVNARMSAPAFTDQVAKFCPRETAAFREASVARAIAGNHGKPRSAAIDEFAQLDAANRAAMLENFGVTVVSKKAPVRAVSASDQ